MGILAPVNWALTAARNALSFRRKTGAGEPDIFRIPHVIGRARAGVRVDPDLALTYSAVWACVRIIGETMACLPWHVMRNRPDGGKEQVKGSPLTWLLHNRPNPEMTAFTFREVTQGHVLLYGNAYAEIERDQAGIVKGLWPLAPDRMKVTRDDGGNIVYVYRDGANRESVLRASQVFHVKGLGYDGLQGYSVIQYARDIIGLGLATERFGSSFFGNGARPGGIFEHPHEVGEVALKHLKESIQAHHGGPDRAGGVMILEEGMKWTTTSVPPDDAQFLETRKFQVTEIARWFRVPPHKLADLDRATFSNIEEQSIAFVTDTIVPWAIRYEQEANIKLLSNKQSRTHFTRMNINGLLRGDFKSRMEGYKIGREMGIFSGNDILRKEDMNPLPGKEGKFYMVPMNFQTTKAILEAEKPKPEPAPVPVVMPPQPGEEPPKDPDADEKPPEAKSAIEGIKRAYTGLFADAVSRVVSKETLAARRAFKKYGDNPQGFELWVAEFYDKHEEYVRDAVEPVIQSMSDIIKATVGADHCCDVLYLGNTFSGEYVRQHKGQLVAALNSQSVEYLCGIWSERLPSRVAVELTESVSNAVAK